MTDTPPSTHSMTLQAIRRLIEDDGFAVTFQSRAQYRGALLRHVDSLVDRPGTALSQPSEAAPLAAEHRAVIEEAAQVLESAAAHNHAKGRTVLERTQQDRADRLRAILAAPSLPAAAPAAGDELRAKCRALIEKWHKDAVDTGFATSEAAVELEEVLEAHQPAAAPAASTREARAAECIAAIAKLDTRNTTVESCKAVAQRWLRENPAGAVAPAAGDELPGLPRYKLVPGEQREWMVPATDGPWCKYDHARALIAHQPAQEQAAPGFTKCSGCDAVTHPDNPEPACPACAQAAQREAIGE